MKKSVITLLFCAVLAVSVSAAVVDLTPENFDEQLNAHKFAFIEFFAPWCGHCKSLAPEYEKFGTAFDGKADVLIAKVDADAHKELATRFGVSGYPTLKFFVDGKPEDYSGGRTLEDLIKYVNERVPTSSRARVPPPPRTNVVVLTPENFDKVVLDESKHVLVEFYAPWCGHCKRLAPVWDTLSDVFRGESDVVIAKVDADAHKSLGEKYGVTGFPTIKFFPKDKKDGLAFEGGRDLKDLVDYVNENCGTHRTAEGRFKAAVGVISELSAIGREMFAGDLSAFSKLEAAAANIKDKALANSVKLYTRYLENIKKSKESLLDEFERVSRMLKGSLSPKKNDEFTIRHNIIASILNLEGKAAEMLGTAKDAAKDAAEKVKETAENIVNKAKDAAEKAKEEL